MPVPPAAFQPLDTDGDGNTDQVGVDDTGPHGVPDGTVDRSVDKAQFRDDEGNIIEVAVLGVKPPPIPPPRQVTTAEWLASQQAKRDAEVDRIRREAAAALADVERRSQEALSAAWSVARRWWRWLVGLLAGGGVAVVYYLVATFVLGWNFFGGGAMTATPEVIYTVPPAAEAWLESVRPLLDDPTSETDDYDRGRKALGLEGE